MSTITLPNIRVSSDLQVKVRLKDGGVAVDWTTLSKIRAHVYSDAQRALAGRCDVAIDAEDPTVIICDYSANKPQYLGVNRIIVQATYQGETKTYDKPAFTFVRWTDDQEGEELFISDPDVDVEIDVEDVTSSILQKLIDACIKATEEAQEVVDTSRGPRGFSAYEVAVQNGFVGTEEEWLASLQGEDGDPGPQGVPGPAGPAGVTSAEVSVDNTTGTPSAQASVNEGVLSIAFSGLKGEQGQQGQQGIQGIQGVQGVQGETGPAGKSAYQVAVDEGFEGTEEQWLDSLVGPQGATGAQGPAGPAGVTSAEASVDNTSSQTPTASVSVSNGVLSLAFTGLKGNPGDDGVGFDDAESPTPADGTFIIHLDNGDDIIVDMNHEHASYFSKVIGTAQPSGGFLPDVAYNLGEISGAVTFALAAAVNGHLNHYFWMFSTGSTAPTVTWPSGITWADGSAPTVAASKHYEISILDGIAYYSEV